MITYVHRNCADLARICRRAAHERFGLNVVKVSSKDGNYRAEATDGHRAVVIQGQVDPRTQPTEWIDDHATDAFTNPDGYVLMPAKVWSDAFKRTGRGPLGIATVGENIVYGCESSGGTSPLPQEEPFPVIDSIVPASGLFRFTFNAAHLIDILRLVLTVHKRDNNPWVEMIYYGKDKPLGLYTRTDDGQILDALIDNSEEAHADEKKFAPRIVPEPDEDENGGGDPGDEWEEGSWNPDNGEDNA